MTDRKHKYAVVRETWTVVVHDHHDDYESSQFSWEENRCSGNEAEKLGRRAAFDGERSVCNCCASSERKLLGVYDSLEDAQKAHRALAIEDEDYREADDPWWSELE